MLDLPVLKTATPWSAAALSLIIPTYNEVGNIRPMVERIAEVMADRRWELIFVDDDSKDGTAGAAVAMGREGYPVRCLRRIGRRGLSSAVVEGALAATYDVIGVMDADFQHDEAILPQMLDAIAECDLVIGSRHVEGGGLGEWDKSRVQLSDFATRLSRILIGDRVTDPMSGFFMIRRDVFEASVYDLSQQGYKILLDILSSSPRKLRIKELPYVFRSRREGESKLDILILAEFVFLIGEKLSGGLIPPRFILFAAVGGLGLVINLLTLGAMGGIGFHFLKAQAVAILVSMAFNYVVNNMITYRDQRLKGTRFVVGFAVFCIVCSIGAVANIGVAELAINKTGNWPLSGVAGALMGAVFNFGVATKLVWGSRRLRGGALKGRSSQTVHEETTAGADGAVAP